MIAGRRQGMQLEAMLEKCRREQWDVADLDWTGKPREMSRADEIAIVQYFTDMAGIERLAGALFAEQERKAEEPVLREIFRTFVIDEARHAAAAERLARYYDVHRHQAYEINPSLAKFAPHFVDAIKYVSAEIANVYITSGELILDVALLRSINDHVGDAMSQSAMDLVNRDESRHIAVDFHMIEYYCSREYAERLEVEPRPSVKHRLKATWAFAHVLYHASPFFKAVFFDPMEVVDPSGKRMREAFKRIQLIGSKPTARRTAFVRVMAVMQTVYNDYPLARRLFGRAIERFIGVSPAMLARLYTEEERRRVETMSFDELALEALSAKYA
jgi:hypothetical protein